MEQAWTLRSKLKNHIFFRVYNAETAEELLQTVYLKFWEALERGAEVQNVAAYLYKMAYHIVVDYHRKNFMFVS